MIKFEIEAKINEEKKYTSGLGILCNIPSKNIKAFITYNHLMNFDFLNKGEKMMLFINHKEKEINIKLNRFKYTNENLDITIIEIIELDYIQNFIEIDKFIYSKNYVGANFISVFFNGNDDIEYIKGKIEEKKEDRYICNIDSIKEGIIIKDNLKLLGIINANEKEINIIPMNIIINQINFIKCVYEIKTQDINKDIQIINNNHFSKVKNEEIEKEIKVIINGEIKSNILKYKFNKKGNYIIYFFSYNYLTNMSYMFSDCPSLKKIDLSSFNSNQVTNISNMFYKCSSLQELDLSSFNNNKITNMSFLFSDCSSLIKLNLSSFNTD